MAHDAAHAPVQFRAGSGDFGGEARLKEIHRSHRFGHGSSERTDGVEKRRQRPAALHGNATPRGLQANDAAARRGDADRSSGIASDANIGLVVGDSDSAAA